MLASSHSRRFTDDLDESHILGDCTTLVVDLCFRKSECEYREAVKRHLCTPMNRSPFGFRLVALGSCNLDIYCMKIECIAEILLAYSICFAKSTEESTERSKPAASCRC